MARFYIYRKSHTEGRKPLDVAYGKNQTEALLSFAEKNQEMLGDFVAESKCRKIHWWLY